MTRAAPGCSCLPGRRPTPGRCGCCTPGWPWTHSRRPDGAGPRRPHRRWLPVVAGALNFNKGAGCSDRASASPSTPDGG
ncbi:hypothetical protein HBB16_15760 [Pseudonocardia sp. MCCB 268]|nr:hypothetical protein [Pseudonocardia cytotoxica]